MLFIKDLYDYSFHSKFTKSNSPVAIAMILGLQVTGSYFFLITSGRYKAHLILRMLSVGINKLLVHNISDLRTIDWYLKSTRKFHLSNRLLPRLGACYCNRFILLYLRIL